MTSQISQRMSYEQWLKFGLATLMLLSAIGFATPLLAANPALTQKLSLGLNNQTARLRQDISVEASLVTLGDLFDNAGRYSNKPVFRSPSIGQSGTIRAERVIRAARLAGLTRIDQNNIDIVRVTHASQLVTEHDVTKAILGLLRTKGYVSSSDRVDIELSSTLPDQHATQEAFQPFDIRDLRFNRTTGMFAARLTIGGRSDLKPIRLKGLAKETILVPVTTRSIRKGEIIREGDITMSPMPKRQAQLARPAALKDIIGKASRQTLRPGAIANVAYFKEPNIVERSDIVTILFKTGNLTLTMRGKAMVPGTKNDVISVQNLQTNRIIRGRVVSPGLIQVGNSPKELAALGAIKQ